MSSLLIPIIFVWTFNSKLDARQIFVGGTYSSYLLYQDQEEPKGKWQWGMQLGISNIIPNLGLKASGTVISYKAPPEAGPYEYKYTPIVLTFNYNLLPFLRTDLLQLNLETGFGLFFWQGLYNGNVIVLPTGEKMDEKDLGFIGGLELVLKPINNFGISFQISYQYVTSSNIYKYGYFDKDEKFFIDGFGLKLFLP
ncbi:MAG: hypothetical protein ACUVQ3_01245 [bacterium]